MSKSKKRCFFKINELKELTGIVKRSSHDISEGYNEYEIEISNEIYKLIIKSFWDDIFGKLEGRRIKLKGVLDIEKKEIRNPNDIWIKLLKDQN